jgi:outer membrane protein TolC
LLRAQLELKRLDQRRVALRAEERARVQTLNRLRDRPLVAAIATTAHITDLPASASFVDAFAIDDALARSPELASARLGIRRAERSVDLAEKSAYPDVQVGAGLMIRGALPPMWLVTVGGPLPVFSRGTQARAAAEGRARARAAEANVQAIEQTLRLRSEERRTAFAAFVETLAIYDQGLLVQSRATAESTLSQYKVGKVAFASVLEANAGYLADQEGYLQAVAASYRLLIAEAELSLQPTGEGGGGGLGATSMPGAGAMSVRPAPSGASPRGAAPAAAGGGAMSSM